MTSTPNDEWFELEKHLSPSSLVEITTGRIFPGVTGVIVSQHVVSGATILSLIALARSEAVLREAISYRNLDLSSDCPSCNAGSVRIDLVEALAQSDHLRTGKGDI